MTQKELSSDEMIKVILDAEIALEPYKTISTIRELLKTIYWRKQPGVPISFFNKKAQSFGFSVTRDGFIAINLKSDFLLQVLAEFPYHVRKQLAVDSKHVQEKSRMVFLGTGAHNCIVFKSEILEL